MHTYAVQCTSTVTTRRGISSGLRWRSTLGCLLALGGALACDDGGDRGPDLGRGDVDGERLVARTLSFRGGASVQVGWFDDELETPCDFGVAADGQLRCLPAVRQARLGYSSADCAASSALIEIEPLFDGGPQTLALIRRLDGCAGQAQVFRLGAPDTSGRFYFLDQEGVCRETTQGEAWSYYEAEELPPGDMVAGEHTALGQGRLQRYVDAARDGAQQITAEFRDTDFDDDCTFTSAGDGGLRCVPGETSLDEGFTATSDASCVGEAALVPPCRQSSFALRRDPSTCDGRTLVYELGEALADGVALYSEIDGECVQAENELQGAVMRWVGPEVNPAELVGAEVELVGDGRVRGRWGRLEDDSTVFIDFWDTQLETTCSSLTLQDDSIVCAPSDMLHIDAYSYFSDPECDEIRSVAAARNGTCPAEGEIIHARVPSECPGSRFHQVAGEVEGDIFFLNLFTYECRALTEAERATLREIGEEIDPEFEAAEPGSASESRRNPHQG